MASASLLCLQTVPVSRSLARPLPTLTLSAVTADSALLLDCLCVISRIDHELLEPHLAELFPRILYIPPAPHPAAASASQLLTLCIAYHSRARSLPSFLRHIQEVFTSLSSSQGSVRELYPRAAGSPLLAQSFLSTLARAVQSFVTPGQVLSTAQDVVLSLESMHATYITLAAQSAGDNGLGSRKKSRKSRTSTGVYTASEAVAVDAAALSFSILARLAACVLPVLPVQTVAPDAQEEVRVCVRQADFVKDDLFHPDMHDNLDRRTDNWAAGIVLAAALRLLYALQAVARLDFPRLQAERQSGLVGVHQRLSVLPELFLETVR